MRLARHEPQYPDAADRAVSLMVISAGGLAALMLIPASMPKITSSLAGAIGVRSG